MFFRLLRITISFLFLLIYFNTHAQDTTYYDTPEVKRFDVGKKSEGKYDGEVYTYEKNDLGIHLCRVTNYVNGKKEGRGIIYHILDHSSYAPDGYSVINYRNDVMEGPCIEFNQNGNIWRVGQFLNDNESGIWYEYGENGKLTKAFEWHNGTKAEQETYFFSDGKISASGLTTDEVKTGLWVEFDSTNMHFMIGEYQKDSMIVDKTDTLQGNVTYTRIVSTFPAKVGVWKTYNYEGELISEENYVLEKRKK